MAAVQSTIVIRMQAEAGAASGGATNTRPLSAPKPTVSLFLLDGKQIDSDQSKVVTKSAGTFQRQIDVPSGGDQTFPVFVSLQKTFQDSTGATWSFSDVSATTSGPAKTKSIDRLPSGDFVFLLDTTEDKQVELTASYHLTAAAAPAVTPDVIKKLQADLDSVTARVGQVGLNLGNVQNQIGQIETHVSGIDTGVNSLFVYGGGAGGGNGGSDGGDDSVVPASGTSLQARVARELRTVLAYDVSTDKPNQLRAALNNSFDAYDRGGWTEYVWKRRSYAAVADLTGAASGVQAALMLRAANVYNTVQQNLSQISPLRSTADMQNIRALINLCIDLSQQIAEELGRRGGPRLARVEQLFDALMGPNEDQTDPDLLHGQIGALGEQTGLTGLLGFVNDATEETGSTLFAFTSQELIGLRLLWIHSRAKLGAGGTAAVNTSYGLLGVQVGRFLDVIKEGVGLIRSIGPSVDMDSARRAVLFVNVAGSEQPDQLLSVEDLVTWAEELAIDDVPRQMEQGGVIALANVVRPAVAELAAACSNAVTNAQDAGLPPTDFLNPRFQRAWRVVQQGLTGLQVSLQGLGYPLTAESLLAASEAGAAIPDRAVFAVSPGNTDIDIARRQDYIARLAASADAAIQPDGVLA